MGMPAQTIRSGCPELRTAYFTVCNSTVYPIVRRLDGKTLHQLRIDCCRNIAKEQQIAYIAEEWALGPTATILSARKDLIMPCSRDVLHARLPCQ